MNEELLIAAKESDLKKFQELIAKGADLKYTNKEGMSALLIAAVEGRLEIIQYIRDLAFGLLKRSTYPKCPGIFNARTLKGETPLLLAVKFGHAKVIEELLRNSSSVHEFDAEGNTALHLALLNNHLHLIPSIMEREPNLDCLNKHNQSPVDLAIDAGHNEIHFLFNQAQIKKLIWALKVKKALASKREDSKQAVEQIKTSIRSLLQKSETLLKQVKVEDQKKFQAEQEALSKTFKRIEMGYPTDLELKKELEKIQYSEQLLNDFKKAPETLIKRIQVLSKLGANLSYCDESGLSAMHHAISNNNLVEELSLGYRGGSHQGIFDTILSNQLQLGIRAFEVAFSYRVTQAESPLHFTISLGQFSLFRSIFERSEKHGQLRFERTKAGLTVLMNAVYYRRTNMVKYLLKNQLCLVDETDHLGLTALYIAVQERNDEALVLLLDAGADPDREIPGKGTAMQLAEKNNYHCFMTFYWISKIKSVLEKIKQHEKKASDETLKNMGTEIADLFDKAYRCLGALQDIEIATEKSSRQEGQVKKQAQEVLYKLLQNDALATIQEPRILNRKLLLACKTGNVQNLQLLSTQNTDFSFKDEAGSDVLSVCAVYGQVQMMDEILSQKLIMLETHRVRELFEKVIVHGQLETIKYLYGRYKTEVTAIAIREDFVLKSANIDQTEIVDYLLDQGLYNLSEKETILNKMFEMAVKSNNYSFIYLLMNKYKFKVDIADIACRLTKKMLAALLIGGAYLREDILELEDIKSRMEPECLPLLRNAHTLLYHAKNNRKDPLSRELLWDLGPVLNMRTLGDGNTALHWLLKHRNMVLVKQILDGRVWRGYSDIRPHRMRSMFEEDFASSLDWIRALGRSAEEVESEVSLEISNDAGESLFSLIREEDAPIVFILGHIFHLASRIRKLRLDLRNQTKAIQMEPSSERERAKEQLNESAQQQIEDLANSLQVIERSLRRIDRTTDGYFSAITKFDKVLLDPIFKSSRNQFILNERLRIACQYGDVEEFRLLQVQGADLKYINNSDESLLAIAIAGRENYLYSITGKFQELIEYLLENNLVSSKELNLDGETPIYLAVYYKKWQVLNYLCKKTPALIDVANNAHRTPLCLAIEMEDLDSITVLLEHGASLDHTSPHGGTLYEQSLILENNSIIVYCCLYKATQLVQQFQSQSSLSVVLNEVVRTMISKLNFLHVFEIVKLKDRLSSLFDSILKLKDLEDSQLKTLVESYQKSLQSFPDTQDPNKIGAEILASFFQESDKSGVLIPTTAIQRESFKRKEMKVFYDIGAGYFRRKGPFDMLRAMRLFSRSSKAMLFEAFFKLDGYNTQKFTHYLQFGNDTKDVQAAFELLKRLADANDIDAICLLCSQFYRGTKELKKYIPILKNSLKKPIPDALRLLADCVLEGDGIEQDIQQGLAYLNQTITLFKDPESMMKLGVVYLRKKYGLVNMDMAVQNLNLARSKGATKANYWLGIYYETVKKDMTTALKFYRYAAALRDEDAHYRLGKYYEDRMKTPTDERQAFRHFYAAAKRRNKKANLKLAKFYELGLGLEKPDLQKARQSCDLALKYEIKGAKEYSERINKKLKENSLLNDLMQNVSTLLKGEASGLSALQLRESVRCYTGIGRPQDKADALKKIRDCYQSSPSALTKMILAMLLVRESDEKSNQEGLRILTSLKTDQAVFELASCYEHGFGVPQDRIQAMHYYDQLTAKGHYNAGLKLQSLRKETLDIIIGQKKTGEGKEAAEKEAEDTAKEKPQQMIRFLAPILLDLQIENPKVVQTCNLLQRHLIALNFHLKENGTIELSGAELMAKTYCGEGVETIQLDRNCIQEIVTRLFEKQLLIEKGTDKSGIGKGTLNKAICKSSLDEKRRQKERKLAERQATLEKLKEKITEFYKISKDIHLETEDKLAIASNMKLFLEKLRKIKRLLSEKVFSSELGKRAYPIKKQLEIDLCHADELSNLQAWFSSELKRTKELDLVLTSSAEKLGLEAMKKYLTELNTRCSEAHTNKILFNDTKGCWKADRSKDVQSLDALIQDLECYQEPLVMKTLKPKAKTDKDEVSDQSTEQDSEDAKVTSERNLKPFPSREERQRHHEARVALDQEIKRQREAQKDAQNEMKGKKDSRGTSELFNLSLQGQPSLMTLASKGQIFEQTQIRDELNSLKAVIDGSDAKDDNDKLPARLLLERNAFLGCCGRISEIWKLRFPPGSDIYEMFNHMRNVIFHSQQYIPFNLKVKDMAGKLLACLNDMLELNEIELSKVSMEDLQTKIDSELFNQMLQHKIPAYELKESLEQIDEGETELEMLQEEFAKAMKESSWNGREIAAIYEKAKGFSETRIATSAANIKKYDYPYYRQHVMNRKINGEKIADIIERSTEFRHIVPIEAVRAAAKTKAELPRVRFI